MTSFPRVTEVTPPLASKRSQALRGIEGWFVVGPLIVCAFISALVPISTRYLWDEAVYLSTADNLGRTAPYYTEISYRPPLLPVLLKLGGRVLPMETFGHVLVAAFFAAGVTAVFLLGRRLWNPTAGLISAGLMVASPFFVHWSHKIMSDIPAVTLGLASILCFYAMVDEERHRLWLSIAAGILFTAAVLMRFLMGTLLIFPLYLLAAKRLALKRGLVTMLSAALAAMPYLVWAQLYAGGMFKPFLQAAFIVRGSELVTGNLYYASAALVIAGPLTVLGLVFYLVPGLGRRRTDVIAVEVPLLLWAILVSAYLTNSPHKEIRYLLPVVPILFLIAGAGYARCKRRPVLVAAALAALIAGAFTLSRLPYFNGSQDLGEDQLLAYADQTRDAANFLRPRLTPGQVIYTSSLYPIMAWYTKWPTEALWPWDDSFYLAFPKNMRTDGYLVVYKQVKKEPTLEWLDHRLEFRKIKDFPDMAIYAYDAPPPEP